MRTTTKESRETPARLPNRTTTRKAKRRRNTTRKTKRKKNTKRKTNSARKENKRVFSRKRLKTNTNVVFV